MRKHFSIQIFLLLLLSNQAISQEYKLVFAESDSSTYSIEHRSEFIYDSILASNEYWEGLSQIQGKLINEFNVDYLSLIKTAKGDSWEIKLKNGSSFQLPLSEYEKYINYYLSGVNKKLEILSFVRQIYEGSDGLLVNRRNGRQVVISPNPPVYSPDLSKAMLFNTNYQKSSQSIDILSEFDNTIDLYLIEDGNLVKKVSHPMNESPSRWEWLDEESFKLETVEISYKDKGFLDPKSLIYHHYIVKIERD